MWKLILLPSDDCISWLYSSENLASHQSILFMIILAILMIFFLNEVLKYSESVCADHFWRQW